MSSPIGIVNRLLKKAKPKHDDDWSDRLHYVLAPTFLLFLATLHGMKQYFGKPVECFPPAEMVRKKWAQYAEAICFVENTYFVGMDEPFPMERVDRGQRHLHYYQWVPFLLAGQALLFILPKLILKAFNRKTGLDISSLLDRCEAVDNWCEWVEEERAGVEIGTRMGESIHLRGEMCKQRRNKNWNLPAHFGQKKSPSMLADNSITICYLSFKFLNFCLTFAQLLFLDWFISPNESNYFGFSAFSDLMSGIKWHQNGLFPRVTFCDILIRQPQRNMPPLHYTFQCFLRMNWYNEKIFLLIWFFLLGLSLFSFGNFLLWCFRLLNPNLSKNFIADHLHAFSPSSAINSQNLAFFIRNWLGKDGCTILRLMDVNCSPLVTVQIVGKLWQLFCHEQMVGILMADGNLERPKKCIKFGPIQTIDA